MDREVFQRIKPQVRSGLPAEEPVVLGPNRFNFPPDPIDRNLVTPERFCEQLQRRLELFDHDIGRTQGHELVDGADVTGPQHDPDRGIDIPSQGHTSPLLGR